jgi:hypothetical protein
MVLAASKSRSPELAGWPRPVTASVGARRVRLSGSLVLFIVSWLGNPLSRRSLVSRTGAQRVVSALAGAS